MTEDIKRLPNLDYANGSQFVDPEVITVAKGAGIVFFGVFIGSALKYLFEIIVARNLGPDIFGIFLLGITIFRLLEMITILGLDNGVLRFVALFNGEKDEARVKGTIHIGIRIVLCVSIGVSLLVVVLSKSIALGLFHSADLISVLKIVLIAVPFNAVTVVILFATVGFKTMKYRVYARDLIESFSRVLIALIVFSLGWKIFGALFAFISSIVISAVFALVFLKKLFPNFFQKNPPSIYETKALIRFSWPLLFVKLLDFLIFWIGVLMLGYFRTSHEVGIYGPTQRTAILIWIIFTCFNSIFAPIISDLCNKKEFIKLRNLFKIVTKWIFSFSLPGFILLIFFAKEILYLWGNEFVEGAPCLIILSTAYLFLSAVGPVRHMIMMSGRTQINLFNSIIGFILVISLNLVLVSKYGMIGAAIATAFSLCVVSLLGLIEVYVILKMHPFRLDFLKPLFAGGVSLLILIFFKRYLFAVSQPYILLSVGGFIFLVSYAAILILLRLEHEDKIIIDKIRQKLTKLSQ